MNNLPATTENIIQELKIITIIWKKGLEEQLYVKDTILFKPKISVTLERQKEAIKDIDKDELKRQFKRINKNLPEMLKPEIKKPYAPIYLNRRRMRNEYYRIRKEVEIREYIYREATINYIKERMIEGNELIVKLLERLSEKKGNITFEGAIDELYKKIKPEIRIKVRKTK